MRLARRISSLILLLVLVDDDIALLIGGSGGDGAYIRRCSGSGWGIAALFLLLRHHDVVYRYRCACALRIRMHCAPSSSPAKNRPVDYTWH
jgi:hypothetical protein